MARRDRRRHRLAPSIPEWELQLSAVDRARIAERRGLSTRERPTVVDGEQGARHGARDPPARRRPLLRESLPCAGDAVRLRPGVRLSATNQPVRRALAVLELTKSLCCHNIQG